VTFSTETFDLYPCDTHFVGCCVNETKDLAKKHGGEILLEGEEKCFCPRTRKMFNRYHVVCK
jgi:hypothetical protein